MLCRQTTFVRAPMAQTHASQTRVRVVTGEVLDLCRVPARYRSASLSRGCTCAEYALEDGMAPKDCGTACGGLAEFALQLQRSSLCAPLLLRMC